MEFDEARVMTPGQHYRPETSDDVRFNQRTVPAAFIPIVGYAIMASFAPYEIGVNLWSFVALLAIPAVSGLILHSIGDGISVHRRATRAFILNFVLFVIYGLVSMSMIHDRIQESASGFGALPAMLLAAAGYGLIAAVVAGFVASLPVHHHAEQGY